MSIKQLIQNYITMELLYSVLVYEICKYLLDSYCHNYSPYYNIT